MSTEHPTVVWERLPGRRWRATVWHPGEREQGLARAAEEWSALRAYSAAVAQLNAVSIYAMGRCACCGQSYSAAPGQAFGAPSLIGALFGTGLL